MVILSSFASLKLETSALLVCLFLVLTTGKFFNKVNQADSENCNVALTPLGGCDTSDFWNKSSGYAYSIRRIPNKRVVTKNCDLSVTNIRRANTLIGICLLSTWPVLRGSGNCFLGMSFVV